MIRDICTPCNKVLSRETRTKECAANNFYDNCRLILLIDFIERIEINIFLVLGRVRHTIEYIGTKTRCKYEFVTLCALIKIIIIKTSYPLRFAYTLHSNNTILYLTNNNN